MFIVDYSIFLFSNNKRYITLTLMTRIEMGRDEHEIGEKML